MARPSLIVAMSRNRIIGDEGRIPWHLPAELQLFKRITMGHHIVMGRKTFESIGRLLPGRTSVVVTRNPAYAAPGAVVTHSLEQALAACGDDPEPFVIGGAELFAAALPLAARLYLTTVEADIPGDTVMPDWEQRQWREVSAQAFPADAANPLPYRLCVLERIADDAGSAGL